MYSVPHHTFIRLCFFASIGSILLLFTRLIWTRDDFFWFLPWNLGLAWIPLLISMLYFNRQKHRISKAGQFLAWGLWLLFYPNAPYIVTDLVHLKLRSPVPVLFDFLLITSFAVTGLLIAHVSLTQMHEIVKKKRGKVIGWYFVGIVMVLTSFGIYLGRILRWNSWDIVTNPVGLLPDIMRAIHLFIQPITAIVTFLFAMSLFAFYWGLAQFAEAIEKK